MPTPQQPPSTKAKVRKTQRHFFFMAGFIEETHEEAQSTEPTPSAPPPGVELVKAFTEERPSRPNLRKAAVAVVIPFPLKKVAASR